VSDTGALPRRVPTLAGFFSLGLFWGAWAAVVVTRVVPVGTPIPSAPSAPPPDVESCAQPTNTPYVVDSVAVVVTQTACRGTWVITAWSTTPAIYVQGQTHSAANTKVLNAIMVTLRFASLPRLPPR